MDWLFSMTEFAASTMLDTGLWTKICQQLGICPRP